MNLGRGRGQVQEPFCTERGTHQRLQTPRKTASCVCARKPQRSIGKRARALCRESTSRKVSESRGNPVSPNLAASKKIYTHNVNCSLTYRSPTTAVPALGQVYTFDPSSSWQETRRAHDLSLTEAPRRELAAAPRPTPSWRTGRSLAARDPGSQAGLHAPRAPRSRPAKTLSSPRNVGFRAGRRDSLRGEGRQGRGSSARGHRDPAI